MPGSRQFVVTETESGLAVVRHLRVHLSLPHSKACRLILKGKVYLDGRPCFEPDRRLRRGQRVIVHWDASQSKKLTVAACQQQVPVIRFVDAHIIVVDKPAGLTTMRHSHEIAEFGQRARRFLPATLADLLPDMLPSTHAGRKPKVRAVHRLDKDTSGLVVFARTAEAERNLGQQFRQHSIERRYLAIVRGKAQSGRIESNLIENRGDGRRGSSSQAGQGKRAVTHVRVVEDLAHFTFVECQLDTGRTHQVRIHLGEKGTPICGERVYDRGLGGNQVIADDSGSPRLALHATVLGFLHPATRKQMRWTSRLPADINTVLTRLRSRRTKNQPRSS